MSIHFSLEMFRHHSGGVVECVKTPEGVEFHRFTRAQSDTYPEQSDFRKKCFACSGVELRFLTDAEKLSLHWRAAYGSSRKFAYFDCFVDSVLVKHDGIENYEETPDGTLELELPRRRCQVRIVFPNLTKITVKSLKLAGNCTVETMPSRRKMLSFGDSITQGYDARFPSQTYAALLAEDFGLELVNKAIGGDRFKPELLDTPDSFVPALITVAYGTNDWSHLDCETFRNNARLFMEKLVKLYPETPVALLLPLWRADCGKITAAGTFEEARTFLSECAAQFPQIQRIQPEVPHNTQIFSDNYLHPNDWGNALMLRSIEKQLKFRNQSVTAEQASRL